VTDSAGTRVGLAIVRAVVDEAGTPLIRVLSIDDIFGDERVIVMTSSPDRAGAAVTEWLRSLLRAGWRIGPDDGGDSTVTPA
jgi:hypothetical protein